MVGSTLLRNAQTFFAVTESTRGKGPFSWGLGCLWSPSLRPQNCLLACERWGAFQKKALHVRQSADLSVVSLVPKRLELIGYFTCPT